MGDSGSRESLVQTITICGQTIKWLDEEGNRRGKLVARTVSDERLMGVLCSTAERQTEDTDSAILSGYCPRLSLSPNPVEVAIISSNGRLVWRAAGLDFLYNLGQEIVSSLDLFKHKFERTNF
ncbi:hypothetical protein RRG08_045422 [Elysia crispata]|uniref:Uncharacterized protein n=1 Tax=Elysia crispata TaxID=231223 RepID=A0AAE1AYY4_9GAST|nr:hypothetical protein RRG08_045422 [Elysia crispata]